MTQEELDRIVESKLEARLAARMQADRERLRAEIAAEIRREIDREHYDRINRRHPSEDRWGGLGPEGYAARLKAMDERAAQANREMDIANSRVVDGSLKAQRAAAAGGRSGFRFK
jgi:hypothetical protein